MRVVVFYLITVKHGYFELHSNFETFENATCLTYISHNTLNFRFICLIFYRSIIPVLDMTYLLKI